MTDLTSAIIDELVLIEPADENVEDENAVAVVNSPTDERVIFYGALPKQDADELRTTADRINARMRGAVMEIGNDLLKVRDKFAGSFNQWLKLEFNMSKSTAYNYINAVERFAGTPKVIEALPPATVYKLAAKATPEEVRRAVVEKISMGTKIDAQEVERRILEAKQKAQNVVTKKPDSADIVKAKALAGASAMKNDMGASPAKAAVDLIRDRLKDDFPKFQALIVKADITEFLKLVRQ